ncbi:SpoIIE family protein phosphatase [Deltaproteobacteria bacterium TL4]
METDYYRVLIVDDSRFIRMSIRRVFLEISNKNYDIFEAENGKIAIELLGKNKIELVITDIEMPVMGGLELIKHIRSVPELENLPVLFLTSHTDEQTKIKAFELGATDYLSKPFLSQELEARTVGYIERRRAFHLLVEEIEARKLAEAALQNSYQTIMQQKQQMDNELDRARGTQQILFPDTLPELPNAKIAVKYVPMDKIGGDFYDVLSLGSNKYGFLIADVTGHGIPAALLSFMVAVTFKNSAYNLASPQTALDLTNEMLAEKMPDGTFATMFYAIYDTQSQKLSFSNAGHPPALIIRNQKEPHILKLNTSGIFVGQFPPGLVEFEEKEIQLLPGDKILMYTDAIIEMESSQGQRIDSEGLDAFLLKNNQVPVEKLLEKIYDFGLDFSNKIYYDDDITLIGLEIF